MQQRHQQRQHKQRQQVLAAALSCACMRTFGMRTRLRATCVVVARIPAVTLSAVRLLLPPSAHPLTVFHSSCTSALPHQNYFTRVLEDDIKAVIKPQYVDHIPKAVRGNVDEVLSGKDQRGIKPYLLDKLDLTQVRRWCML